MEQMLKIPHRIKPGLCPVNGIRDLVQWRTGRDWSNEFLHGLGQGGGFAYLRFSFADPPRQVYWGVASPRQHKYLAGLFQAEFSEYENRSFKSAWSKAQKALEIGTPPILGPLDMFYLHFYPGIHHQRHIPIHYLLLVGYDRDNAYVLDTGQDEMQCLPLSELQLAWDVNVPGLGKRNRLVTLALPEEIDSTEALTCKSICEQAEMMLRPPVSMLGIPAMEKLAREVSTWPKELGKEVAGRCLLQVREYLNSPPDLMGSHLTAGRDIYITFLEQASVASGLDFSQPIHLFQKTIAVLPQIAESIQQDDLAAVALGLASVAETERQAFTILHSCVTGTR